MDKFTLLLRGAIRVLIGGFPIRASIGILIGFVLDGIRLFFVASSFPLSPLASGLDAVPLISELALGIMLSFSTFLLPGRRALPEKFTKYFNILDEAADRLSMSQHQKHLLYQPFFKSLNDQILASKELDVQKAAEEALLEFESNQGEKTSYSKGK